MLYIYAQGQLKNTPFSDKHKSASVKRTWQNLPLAIQFVRRWRPEQSVSSVLIFKYDCHIGKMK